MGQALRRSDAPPAPHVVWRPHEGSQRAFLACPVWEVLYEGERGPGKSDALLMDFAQHVGRGYGRVWRGIIFRREYKHLDDLVSKSKRWFFQLFPGARWISSKSDYKWVWPNGEELLFRALKDPDEYWSYHGHEYPWIGWDELTNWPSDECYKLLMSCSRSSDPHVPRRYRSSANPWGAGHGWVKARFVDPAPPGTLIVDGEGQERLRIHGRLAENPNIVENDPHYVRRLRAIENPELRRAWLDGDWDVNPGGFLQGVWDRARHVVEPFEIPREWTRWRALDWGFARPFACGWYAMDPDGVIYLYRELYGWGGKPDVGARLSASEVADKIVEIEGPERALGITFRRNPADTNLWNHHGVQLRNREITPALLMARRGVRWQPASKGPGSRVAGLQVLVERLRSDRFFVFSTCRHWLRTVPALQYDPDDWEDVDPEQEAHHLDQTRYALQSRQPDAHRAKDDDQDEHPHSFAAITAPEPKKLSRYRRR